MYRFLPVRNLDGFHTVICNEQVVTSAVRIPRTGKGSVILFKADTGQLGFDRFVLDTELTLESSSSAVAAAVKRLIGRYYKMLSIETYKSGLARA